MKPRALDLFCGAGGATRGLQLAGFHVTGVDIKPQPRYVGDSFVRADALRPPFRLSGFDLVWASPPCQFATQMSARWRGKGGKGGKADTHPNLLTPTLEWLSRCGVPWVVENVVGARDHMPGAFLLHGGMFGLGVHRPRLFVSSFFVPLMKARKVNDPLGVYGRRGDGRRLFTRKNGSGRSTQRAASSPEEACGAMGIDWPMGWREVCEAIPPAYSRWIGVYALQALGRAVA